MLTCCGAQLGLASSVVVRMNCLCVLFSDSFVGQNLVLVNVSSVRVGEGGLQKVAPTSLLGNLSSVIGDTSAHHLQHLQEVEGPRRGANGPPLREVNRSGGLDKRNTLLVYRCCRYEQRTSYRKE